MRRQVGIRKNRGNMLILVCVSMGLLCLGLTVGMSFGGLYFAQALLQNQANDLALTAAVALNASDREGQMNNMISRCRGLVYESRNEDNDASDRNYTDIQPLADMLLDESRQSARDLDTERTKLQQLGQAEATAQVNAQFQQMSKLNELILPWIQCKKPKLEGITFGQVKDVQSNVTALSDFNDLTPDDENYIRPQSNRYYANVNAKLPGQDADLNFQLSSLQPPVQNETAPARIALPGAFADTPNGDMNSAVKIDLSVAVGTEYGGKTENAIHVTGVSVANGGGIMR
jgi:hypothetical protein